MKTILLILLISTTFLASAQDTTIVQAEYFFDVDNGTGNNSVMNVSNVADGNFSFNINLAALPAGTHQLYMRTKNNFGKWSQTVKHAVEVLSNNDYKIINGEYFIDTDPGIGNAAAININAQDSAVLQNFSAVLSGLEAGYHTLYIRTKDNNGKWSQTSRTNIEVLKSDVNQVYKAEYFFKTDNGIGNCDSVVFSKTFTDSSFTFNIPLSKIPSGDDTLFIRVADSSQHWSFTVIKNISGVLPLTLVDFNVAKQNSAAQLTWQTSNEINTSYFNIQRSLNGITFTNIGKVQALGSNTKQHDYLFSDNISNINSNKIYYRLQIVDNNASFNYSAIKFINDFKDFNVSVAPNPIVNNSLNLDIFSPINTKLQLNIYNNLGKLIITDKFEMDAGSFNKKINFSQFASGVYILQLNNGEAIKTLKFIK